MSHVPTPDPAGPAPDPQKQLDDLRAVLAQADASIARMNAAYLASQADLTALRAERDESIKRAGDFRIQIFEALDQRDKAEAALAEARARLDIERAAFTEYRQQAEGAARARLAVPQSQKAEDLDTRVAPSVPCVEPIGSTAEQPPDVVTAAERTERMHILIAETRRCIEDGKTQVAYRKLIALDALLIYDQPSSSLPSGRNES